MVGVWDWSCFAPSLGVRGSKFLRSQRVWGQGGWWRNWAQSQFSSSVRAGPGVRWVTQARSVPLLVGWPPIVSAARVGIRNGLVNHFPLPSEPYLWWSGVGVWPRSRTNARPVFALSPLGAVPSSQLVFEATWNYSLGSVVRVQYWGHGGHSS